MRDCRKELNDCFITGANISLVEVTDLGVISIILDSREVFLQTPPHSFSAVRCKTRAYNWTIDTFEKANDVIIVLIVLTQQM